MRTLTVDCTPGYRLSGDTGAFEAKHGLDMSVSSVWRQRLNVAPTTIRVQSAIADVPSAMSASSHERSP